MLKSEKFDSLIDIIDKTKISFSDNYLSNNIVEKPEKIVKKNNNIDLRKRYLEKIQDNEIKERKVEKQVVRNEIISENKYEQIDYNDLKNIVLNCSKCSAASIRKSIIFGEGEINPKLMIIGEGPGSEEDLKNKIFVGKSGQYLRKWLTAINLNLEKDVYFSNIVKCYSATNPTLEIVNSCKPYIERQIELVNPKAILILGKIAANNLLNKNETMKDLRGNIYSYKRIPCIVTYHPAAVLRNLQWRAPVWQDLQKLQKLISI